MCAYSKACLQCGKLFKAFPWQEKKGRGKFCSKACGYAYPRTYHNPDRQWISCQQCGKEIILYPSVALRGGRTFCSRKCQADSNGTLEEQFLKYVQKTETCWIWVGAKTPAGYGCFNRKGKFHYAHRTSYELFRGPIPDGLFACHDCPDGDNPACVNPNHLFLGTQTENLADMRKKGRDVNSKRKLT